MNPVGRGGGEVTKEVARDPAGDLLMQLHEGELGRAVDRDEQGELALLGQTTVHPAASAPHSLVTGVCTGQFQGAIRLQTPIGSRRRRVPARFFSKL